MIFTALFVSAFVIGWLACAYIPWLVTSIVTHGRAGFGTLALCLLAGLVAAIAVPVLGLDNEVGIAVSFAMAAASSAVVVALRRIAGPHLGTASTASTPTEHRL
jgi:hypothetical protein